jgi:hypothetical protein
MDEMLSQFKDMTALTEYASAQYQTILELSRSLQALTEERDHLKMILEGAMPLLESEKRSFFDLDIPNEKIIADIQLGILKGKAMSGPGGSELTLEETKKVEVYSKILANLKANDSGRKPAEKEVKALSNAELLAQIQALPTNG